MSITVLGVDPGTEESGYALYDPENNTVEYAGIADNRELESLIPSEFAADRYACEWVESFGMPVGKEIFETVHFIGRLSTRTLFYRVTRKEVKLHLCNSARAKDKNIRQAILDRFEPTGGGKTPQIGTKSKPGPLYGMSSHKWSALAVAITFAETKL